MKMPFIALSIALAACGIAETASAQGWPNRTVRIVVPYAPGGGVSVVAQIVGNKLSELVKQPVVIDNRPGAGGNVGADVVAKAHAGRLHHSAAHQRARERRAALQVTAVRCDQGFRAGHHGDHHPDARLRVVQTPSYDAARVDRAGQSQARQHELRLERTGLIAASACGIAQELGRDRPSAHSLSWRRAHDHRHDRGRRPPCVPAASERPRGHPGQSRPGTGGSPAASEWRNCPTCRP